MDLNKNNKKLSINIIKIQKKIKSRNIKKQKNKSQCETN